MRKIILIFSIILLITPSVIAGFGGGNPGSTLGSTGGSMSSGGVSGVQGEVTVIIKEGEYRRIQILDDSYTLRVTEVDSMYVWISITPMNIIQKINIGATRRFDLNGNGIEDFLVQYRRNMDNKALLVYSIISDKVVEQIEPVAQVVKSIEKKQEIKPITVEQVDESKLGPVISGIIILVIIIFGAYWYKENWSIYKPKSKRKQKKIRLK